MYIYELANIYMQTTRPSEIKKQKMGNIIDVMVRIRDYQILQIKNTKIANNRIK